MIFAPEALQLAIFLVGVTTAISELIKRIAVIPSRFMPLVSVVVGLVLGMTMGLHWLLAVIVGLAGSGIYDLGTKTIANVK